MCTCMRSIAMRATLLVLLRLVCVLLSAVVACGRVPNRSPSFYDAGEVADDVSPDKRDAEARGDGGDSSAPAVLAIGQRAKGMAVDSASIYWTGDENVSKAPISGGPVTVLASGQANPRGIAVDSENVYWTNSRPSGQIMSVPISGGVPRVIADAQRSPLQVAARDGFVYWTNIGDGTIMRASSHGGEPTRLAQRQGAVVAIAIDNRAVYWSSIGQRVIRSLSIMNDGDVAAIATEQEAPDLALVDGRLYWASADLRAGEASILQLDTVSREITELTESPSPMNAVADRKYVYWIDVAGQAIMKVPAKGGSPSVVAIDRVGPTLLIADEANLYWSNDDSIFCVAK